MYVCTITQGEAVCNLERMKKMKAVFSSWDGCTLHLKAAVTLLVAPFLMISGVISINEIVAVCISHFASFFSQKYPEPNVMAAAAVSPEINLGPVFHSLGAIEFIVFELERSLSVSSQSWSFVTVQLCEGRLGSPVRLY